MMEDFYCEDLYFSYPSPSLFLLKLWSVSCVAPCHTTFTIFSHVYKFDCDVIDVCVFPLQTDTLCSCAAL